jgi:hypothetical protein
MRILESNILQTGLARLTKYRRLSALIHLIQPERSETAVLQVEIPGTHSEYVNSGRCRNGYGTHTGGIRSLLTIRLTIANLIHRKLNIDNLFEGPVGHNGYYC